MLICHGTILPTSLSTDEAAVPTAYFTIERLLRLKAKAVDSALTVLLAAAQHLPSSEGVGPSLGRRALFSCMVERSLPIPLALLGLHSMLLIDDEPAVLRSTSRVLRQAAPDLQLFLA